MRRTAATAGRGGWRALGTILLGLLLGVAGQRTASAAEPPSPRNGEHSAAELAAYQAQMAKDESEHPTLAIGAPAPDFSLRGVDGKVHALADYKASVKRETPIPAGAPLDFVPAQPPD